MDCQYCKESRILLYRERIDVKLPYHFKPRAVEVIDRIDTDVYCTFYKKVVSTKSNNKYCEMERGVFDDMPEKYEPYPEYE